MNLKIETGSDIDIHSSGPNSEFALCGLIVDGDPVNIEPAVATNEPIDCYDCIQLIEYVKDNNFNY